MYSPGDAEKENVAVGKSAVEHASRTKPVYIIEIEKNGDLYAKTQDQISRVWDIKREERGEIKLDGIFAFQFHLESKS